MRNVTIFDCGRVRARIISYINLSARYSLFVHWANDFQTHIRKQTERAFINFAFIFLFVIDTVAIVVFVKHYSRSIDWTPVWFLFFFFHFVSFRFFDVCLAAAHKLTTFSILLIILFVLRLPIQLSKITQIYSLLLLLRRRRRRHLYIQWADHLPFDGIDALTFYK